MVQKIKENNHLILMHVVLLSKVLFVVNVMTLGIKVDLCAERTLTDSCFPNDLSRASERCHQEKRKTINGEDILFAMNTLGFDNYVEPLKQYLQKYREVCVAEFCVIIL